MTLTLRATLFTSHARTRDHDTNPASQPQASHSQVSQPFPTSSGGAVECEDSSTQVGDAGGGTAESA
jgi:hypothetical protein